jgi:hypothetical protein
MIKRLPPPAHHLMALDVGHMKSLLTVQIFFGEPGVSSENRTWRSSENLEDLDKPAGDHLKTCCWRSSETGKTSLSGRKATRSDEIRH